MLSSLLILSKNLTNKSSFCKERLCKDLGDAGFLFLGLVQIVQACGNICVIWDRF